MECDICTEQFDGAERLPKSMPCGHTACLQCLRRLPDCSCPTCRRDFNGPPEGLPNNFTVLKFLEGRRLDSTPIVWCSDCRTAATSLCKDHVHNVMPTRTALRHHLQDALPLAAEQLLTFQDQCLDDQVLSALLLLMVESWEVSLRGGGHELTGTLRNNTEDPCMKVLWLLLAALTEDQAATRRDPPPAAAPSPSAAAPTQGPQPAAAPAPSAAASTPSATAPAPSAAALTPIQGPPRAEVHPTREMDVGDISWRRPEDMKPEKAAALEEALGVTRLVDVRCHRDPA
ncbi:uncharacterized protein LOC113214308 [Frankliniella occidentalis]|uniref:Uncharacterized protein LOC113214308 n=1 Tax=Frankliniella occidentalis TaxID=133901 RepID=A0A6J1T979_FRAOC|nr:uncharacterized protein LOC113214308 [Frankliniella occidentalis]XP_026289412.2 uncharacterized protein LOC113214308 [Frankliniella occidentalis]